MYAHLLACFPGWTWEYIDEQMTIPRYLDLMQYQRDNPPLHMMVAAYLGAGKEAPAATSSPAGLDNEGQSIFDVFPQ